MEVRLQGKKEAPLKGIDPVLAEINKRLQSYLRGLGHSALLGSLGAFFRGARRR